MSTVIRRVGRQGHPRRSGATVVLVLIVLVGCTSPGRMRTKLPTAEIDWLTGIVLTPYAVEVESHFYERPEGGWLLCRARLRPDGVERFLGQPTLLRGSDLGRDRERARFQGAPLDLLSRCTIHTTRRFLTATSDFMATNTIVLIDMDDPRNPRANASKTGTHRVGKRVWSRHLVSGTGALTHHVPSPDDPRSLR